MTNLLDLTKLPEAESFPKFITDHFPGTSFDFERVEAQVSYSIKNKEFKREDATTLASLCDKFFEKYNLEFITDEYKGSIPGDPTLFSRMYVRGKDHAGTTHIASAYLQEDKSLTLILTPWNVMSQNYNKREKKKNQK